VNFFAYCRYLLPTAAFPRVLLPENLPPTPSKGGVRAKQLSLRSLREIFFGTQISFAELTRKSGIRFTQIKVINTDFYKIFKFNL
jgi:hypothetical protein